MLSLRRAPNLGMSCVPRSLMPTSPLEPTSALEPPPLFSHPKASVVHPPRHLSFFLFILCFLFKPFSFQTFYATTYYTCRGGRTTDAMGWLKRGGGSRALVGSRGEVGMSGRGTPDIHRFGALWRDNTPSPAECGLCVIVQSCPSSCTREEGRQAKA